MGGCVTSKDELEHLTSKKKVNTYASLNLESDEIIPLPKGGILFKTAIGKQN